DAGAGHGDGQLPPGSDHPAHRQPPAARRQRPPRAGGRRDDGDQLMGARWMALGLRRRDGRRGAGQVLVLFALSIVILLAFAGLAFDIGRFYSEKRLLQNAADAEAMSAANAFNRGGTDTVAREESKSILTRNYLSDPTV